MSTTNSKLGFYDMVITLSAQVINKNFASLQRKGRFDTQLQYLTTSEGKSASFISSQEDGFSEVLKKWEAFCQLKKEIRQLEADKKIYRKDQKNEKYKEARRKLNTKREELEDLEFNAEDEKIDFTKLDIFFNGKEVGPPKIGIIDASDKKYTTYNQYQELLFYIDFIDGDIEFIGKNNNYWFDLKGCRYAFKVPLGSMEITKSEMTEDALAKVNKHNLSDKDFTFNQLFLNFSNANASEYDEKFTKLPTGLNEQSQNILRTAITTGYSNFLKEKEGRYILGYQAKRKKKLKSKQSMFDPVSLNFSVSPEKDDTHKSNVMHKSGFNYLMGLEVKKNDNPDEGIIKNNLLQCKIDDQAHGLLAIDSHTYEDKFIRQLDQSIIQAYKKNGFSLAYDCFQSNENKAKLTYGNTEKDDDKQVTTQKEVEITRVVSTVRNSLNAGHQNKDQTKLKITYKIKSSVKKNVKIFHRHGVKIFHGHGDTEFNVPLSTEGAYRIEDENGKKKPKAKKGKITFEIVCLPDGKLDVEQQHELPQLAFDTEIQKHMNKLKPQNDFEKFIRRFSPSVILKSLEDIYREFHNVKNTLKPSLDDLESFDIDAVSGKVILPVNAIYKFKNIRKMSNTPISDPQNAILFDITYSIADQ